MLGLTIDQFASDPSKRTVAGLVDTLTCPLGESRQAKSFPKRSWLDRDTMRGIY
jgi:hypothetical protein